jgi:Multimeric flavodoxin WrbA
VEQGKREQEKDYRPKIKTKVDNIKSYDTILIGSPIWWYEIAPPVKTFLQENDLSGKNVVLYSLQMVVMVKERAMIILKTFVQSLIY